MDGGARAAPVVEAGVAIGFAATGVWEGIPERAAGAAGFVAPGRATAAGRPEFMGRLYRMISMDCKCPDIYSPMKRFSQPS